jgi:hypothetical protein
VKADGGRRTSGVRFRAPHTANESREGKVPGRARVHSCHQSDKIERALAPEVCCSEDKHNLSGLSRGIVSFLRHEVVTFPYGRNASNPSNLLTSEI